MNKVYLYNDDVAKNNGIKIPLTSGKMRLLFMWYLVITIVSVIIIFVGLLAASHINRYFGYAEEIMRGGLILSIFLVPLIPILLKEIKFMHTQTALVERDNQLYFVRLVSEAGMNYFYRRNRPGRIKSFGNIYQIENEMEQNKKIEDNYLIALENYLTGVPSLNQILCLDECYLMEEKPDRMKISFTKEQGKPQSLIILNVFEQGFPLIRQHIRSGNAPKKATGEILGLIKTPGFCIIWVPVAVLLLVLTGSGICEVVKQESNYQTYVYGKNYEDYITTQMLEDTLDYDYDTLVISENEVSLIADELSIQITGTVNGSDMINLYYNNQIQNGGLDENGWNVQVSITKDPAKAQERKYIFCNGDSLGC